MAEEDEAQGWDGGEGKEERGGGGGGRRKGRYGKKRKLVVSFDEAERKEFLTGFHRRKVKRREKAMEEARQKERKMRLEERKAKRDAENAKLEAARKARREADGMDHQEEEKETAEVVYSDDFTKQAFGQEQVTVTTTLVLEIRIARADRTKMMRS